jgi:dienelactone hydrolase
MRGVLSAIVLAATAMVCASSAAVAGCVGDCNGDEVVTVDELVIGVQQALTGNAGDICPAFAAADAPRVTVDRLITAVNNALLGCPPEPIAFTATIDPDGPALLLTPNAALLGDTTYGVVLTTHIRDAAGNPLHASADFAALAGIAPWSGDGPTALFDVDPNAAGNPYPDGRLVDGSTVHIPDAFAERGLAEERPELAPARAILRETADAIGAAGLFSTTAPVRIPLSAPVDLTTVGPETVRFFARRDPRLDLDALLADVRRLGVDRAAVAVAIAFPTQSVEAGLLAVRDRLDERSARGQSRVIVIDPDPQDALVIGVFHRDAPEFASFFAANPDVGTVVHGILPSPEFRGANGLFDTALVSGAAEAPEAQLDFYLTLPASGGAPRAVIVQHGFGGDDSFVLSVANELARAGLAGIGISAVSHGRRGSPLDLVSSTPLQLRDILRQTNADQMALTRAVLNGIDVDGDGQPDVARGGVDYLGVSLGGILGATFIAVEPTVRAAVLNVAGGRVAFLGDNPGTRPIFAGHLAMEAQLDLQSPDFEVFLARMLALGQQALDPADPLDFARRWRREPFPGFAPRRVLMQEGIGDLLVSNESTEALAAAGGLEAQRAGEDPAGASGLWRFDPPGGHGIFSRADVRAQAFEFLASGGTRIVAE